MLKSKLTQIDYWIEDDITTIIYFDEYYRVHKYEFSRDFSYIYTADENSEPELANYRIVLEKAGNV